MRSLCTTSLTQLTYLNESVQLCLVSTKIFIYIFFLSWVQGLLVLGYCPSPHVILWVPHVVPAFQELVKQTIISFVGCSQGIQLKDLWSNVLPAFHVSWMGHYSEFYDKWLQTAHNWGLAIILLDQQMYQKCSATKLSATPFTAVENQVILKNPTTNPYFWLQ